MSRGNYVSKMLDGMLFMADQHTVDTLAEFVNSGMKVYDVTQVSDSVGYEVVGGTAVISIDGATSKKTRHGLCGSVYGYNTIMEKIALAENNTAVDTIVFRIDSNGGDVYGVDDLAAAIRAIEKRTITLYENRAFSAALYYGTASDEVYATKATQLGSIGVVATFREAKDETIAVMTSRRADNKVCDMADKSCVDRLQAEIDTYEQHFYDAIHLHTGFTDERIAEVFDNGGSIFAERAKAEGFIDGITTFNDLMATFEYKGETMPKDEKKEQVSTADIAAKIAANINAIPPTMRAEESLIALASNPDTTEDQIKAALWDMSQAKKAEQKEQSLGENKKMQEVETESPEKNAGKDDGIEYAADGTILSIKVEE